MIFSYIVTLTCIWWVIFYMVLPFGAEVSHKPKLGHADSAPTKPNLGAKVITTSIISILLTICIIYMIEQGIIRNLVDSYLGFLNNN